MSGSEKEPPLGVYKCKEMVHDIFLQTGQKDFLMAHLRHKTTQHGWAWKMRDELVEYIKKRGPDNINVSHMITDLAPMSRESFPADLKAELLDLMFEATKEYFTIDDSIPAITDPDNADAEAEKTFLYQTKDVKPDPGIGVGIELGESPPPSPEEGSASPSSTPHQSPGPLPSANAAGNAAGQNTPKQSPGGPTPKNSPLSTTARPSTPQTLPPPPVLRPEAVSSSTTIKAEPIVRNSSNEEEEPEEEDDDEDARNNEDDEEDELMDV